MKSTEKKKPVHTIPKGVWESTRPVSGENQTTPASQTTDLQGNGYPENKEKRG